MESMLTNSRNVCFSGGAAGADDLFGGCAGLCGHKVMHFSFEGHKPKSKNDIYVLPKQYLFKADPHLKKANSILKRTFPSGSVYVDNMLRRNFFQIKETKRVYAVTYMDPKTGLPSGGTAWAVVMAAQRGIKEIYLFDQTTQWWWKFSTFNGVFNETIDWKQIDSPPAPSGHYTGIGSRDLTAAGEMAIIELFDKCE